MQDLSAEDRERIAGCIVVASVSGGKDSAALSLWLTENGIEHRRVFADTGWEHPLTYEYLRGPLTAKLGPIDEVRGPRGMAELIRHKGMFPGRTRRFCTQLLKVFPLASYMAEFDGEVVNAIGIRAAESEARANLPRWELAPAPFDCDTWRPLIDWSEQDVIDMHARHGLRPNPLYLLGASRVGCWPCIHARKSDIALVAKLTPGRIDEIRELEALSLAATTARHEKRGTTLADEGHMRPTFFAIDDPARPSDDQSTPIDQVVEWSRTMHGGRKLRLLETEPAGCVRWGLCEGHAAE